MKTKILSCQLINTVSGVPGALDSINDSPGNIFFKELDKRHHILDRQVINFMDRCLILTLYIGEIYYITKPFWGSYSFIFLCKDLWRQSNETSK